MYHVTNHFHNARYRFFFSNVKNCNNLNIGTNEQIKISPFFFFNEMGLNSCSKLSCVFFPLPLHSSCQCLVC